MKLLSKLQVKFEFHACQLRCFLEYVIKNISTLVKKSPE